MRVVFPNPADAWTTTSLALEAARNRSSNRVRDIKDMPPMGGLNFD
jgi:hypothetical protein